MRKRNLLSSQRTCCLNSSVTRVSKLLVSLLFCVLVFAGGTARAQCPYNERFEGATVGASTFTSNGTVFTLTSVANGPFIFISTIDYGWNGVNAADTVFINSGAVSDTMRAVGRISSATPFQLRKFYLYFSDVKKDINDPMDTATVTISGKNGSTPVFNITVTRTDWIKDLNTQNGYNLIDMATFGGQDNTFATITEFTISGGAKMSYIAVDAMSWIAASASIQPTVTTSAATGVGSQVATMNGIINANNLAATDSFQYSTSSTLASGVITVAASPATATGTSNTSISKSLTGLTNGTTYYYRVKGSNCNGNRYGSILSFRPFIPVITTSGTLSAFTACTGSPSTAQSFTASGVDLLGDITVTAPSGFEVSKISATTNFAGSVTMTPSSGTVGNTTIYVRLTGSAGSFSGNVSCASSGAVTKNVAASGTAVTCVPEINVRGNSTDITDGDASPISTDHTDFGTTTTTGNVVRTFTIQNTGTANLNVSAGGITLTGTHASLFTLGGITLPAVIAASGSTTFTVTFASPTEGLKTATVHIASDDANESDYDFAVQGTASSTRFFVDSAATGGNTGNNWANAFTSFQSALSLATSGDTVFVAKGTYKPSTGAGRYKTFALANGVIYWGGFPNGGGTFGQRNFSTRRSVLSGDIGTVGDSTDNCYVVVDASDLTNATRMSGFTIERGNADTSAGFTIHSRAGGICLNNTGGLRMDSLTLRNNFGKSGGAISVVGNGGAVLRGCIFQNNFSTGGGGAMLTQGANTFINCSFSGNRGVNGGAVCINSSPSTYSFSGCTFTNNITSGGGQGGGAVHVGNGNTTTFSNCTFTGNTANGFSGGAVNKFAGTLTFTDCNFTQNAAQSAGAIYSSSGGFNLYRCIFSQNSTSGASSHGGAAYNNGGTCAIENCVFVNNSTSAGAGGAIYNNTGGTLNMTNCSFARNNAGGFSEGGGLTNNSTSNATINNCIFWGNTANSSDAASATEIQHFSGTLNVTNTIWQGNTSGGTIYNMDPLFTDATNGNLSIGVCSPAIDTGANTSLTVDVLGNTRPVDAKAGGLSHDLGAYEYQSTLSFAEVNVQGNSVSINDGDATPASNDHTDFGSQSICSGTIVRTFTIQNTGNANLTLGTVTIGGSHASDFSITANPSSPVSASGSTTFQITFDPSALGVRSADISFTTNDCDETTYNFSIQGTGVDPEINVMGNGNTIIDGDVTPSLTDHTDFGSQSVCSGNIIRTFTIQNTGTSNLTVGSASISGTHASDFTVTATPSSPVSAAGSTTFQVTFNPSAPGFRSAGVTFINNDCDEVTYNFDIQGTGIDPEINVRGNSNTIIDGDITPSLTDHTDFDTQSVCSGTNVRTFTIENTGTSNLTLGTVSISGTNASDFTVTSTPSSPVAPSGSTTFQVTFNPTGNGVRTADISFTTNDCDGATYNFNIQGTGTDPEVNVTGNSNSIADEDATPSLTDHTDFGNQNVCAGSIVRTFTIENTGNENLTFGSVSIGGTNAADFSLTSSPSSPVAGAGSTTFQITFNPSAIGSRTADISFTTNDCDETTYNFSIQGTGIAPDVNVKGNSVSVTDGDTIAGLADHTDFGNQSICSGTIVRTFIIENIGNDTLTFGTVNISGTNAADFSVSSTPTSPVLGSNSSSFQITFNPSAPGVRNANISFTTNDCDETTYNFSIQGTGIDPEINVTGNTLSITDGDNSPGTADHTDFGSQAVCSGNIVRTFTIENNGNSNLTLTSVSISGTNAGDFSVASNPSSPVSASGTTSFQIRFDPLANGTRSADISFTTNDCDEATYNFSIQGTGTDAEANVKGNSLSITDGDNTPALTDHTDFGNISVCSGTIVRTFTIENTGNVDLTLGSLSINGTHASDFSLTTSPSSPIAASGTTTFQITFNPSASGTRSADIAFGTNDCDENPYNFSIQGMGTDAEANVKGNTLDITDGDNSPTTTDHTDFGSVSVCSGTIVRTYTIENTGNVNLSPGTVTISGTNAADFTVTTAPTSPVSASGSTTFQVTFDPSAPGTRSADISFTTNDCDENPYNFSIQGTGIDPEINVIGNSISIVDGDVTPSLADHTDFGNQNINSGTTVRTFTIQNTGSANLTVSNVTITGAASGDYSLTSSPSSPVSASGSTTFQVTFDPSANGSRNASITFTTNDCDEGTYNFDITGVGSAQEINIQGNSTSISDGDNSPSLSDHTGFGDLAPATSLTRTYTIQNTGTARLDISSISITGTHSSLFGLGGITLPDTIAPANSKTFTITFTPSSGGIKTATITVNSNDFDEASYDFAVNGERNCYTNSVIAKPTNDGVNTGGVSTNIYLGYGAQKDTLKAVGFGANVTWSPGTNLSCTTCTTTVFAPTTAGTYVFTASNGCISNSISICVASIGAGGSGTSAKVYLCHKEPVTNVTQTMAVLLRGVPAHFASHPGDKLGTCAGGGSGSGCTSNKRDFDYADLVVDEKDLEITCTPNPFRQSFMLNYHSTSDIESSILIYGMTGNLIEKISMRGFENEMQIGNNLTVGIYTVSFIQGDKNKVFRMIKID